MRKLKALWAIIWRASLILAIIAGGLFALRILLPLILPLMFGSAKDHGNTARAQNTAYNLKNAISAYFTEYRKYPLEIRKADLTTTTGHPLLTILVGNNDPAAMTYNPRKIAFFSGKAARLKDGRYTRGIEYNEDGPSYLWDSWGNLYHVRLDTNHDNQIDDPEFPGQLLSHSILVWSAGPDGNFSTWDDNVKTW
jgi:type II secretory pathway pseudopilin PulG